jgi:hypothetical protein
MSYVSPLKPKTSGRKRAGRVGLNVGVPETLHRQVRIACASRGIRLEEAVTEALDQWIARGAVKKRGVPR